MNSKPILAWAIELVAFLFAMFGGFLTAIAPPGEIDARYAVGLSSFIVLIVLLFISVLSQGRRTKRKKKAWLILASLVFVLAVTSGFGYKWNLGRLTFDFPPEKPEASYVSGTEYTEDASTYLQKHSGLTTSQLVAKFEGPDNKEMVWTASSIRKSKMILLANYVLLVVSLAATVFCLTEGLIGKPRNQRGRDGL